MNAIVRKLFSLKPAPMRPLLVRLHGEDIPRSVRVSLEWLPSGAREEMNVCVVNNMALIPWSAGAERVKVSVFAERQIAELDVDASANYYGDVIDLKVGDAA